MKDIRFVLGTCTKSNIKYYFQYNNKVYFIIQKTDTTEKVLEKMTNIRYAYEKWRSYKSESDDVTKNNSNHSDEENALPKDYSYTTVTFEYEADMPVRQSGAKNQGSKYQIDKIGFAQDGKSAKLSPKYGDFEYKNKDDKVREKRYRDERFKEDKERHKEERRKEKKNGDYVLSEKKGFKKNNSRFEKNNSYRRNDRRQEKSSH